VLSHSFAYSRISSPNLATHIELGELVQLISFALFLQGFATNSTKSRPNCCACAAPARWWGYCTLAKNQSLKDLSRDQAALNRFVDWAEELRDVRLSVFFTPAGEALIHPWYRRALERLTQMSSVVKIAAQTNLSCSLDWVQDCNAAKLALWCTYHSAFVERGDFLEQCQRLDLLKVRYSVGMVGLKENVLAAEELRSLLPQHIYLWINA
jgi:hypothetical protein